MNALPTSTAVERLGLRLREVAEHGGEALFAGALALALLLIGILVARAAAHLTLVLCRATRVDAGLRRLWSAGEPRVPTSALLAWAVRWTVLLAFALLAADLYGFGLSSAVAQRISDLLPRVTVAAIVLIAGLLLSLAFGWTASRLFESGGFSGQVAGRVVTSVLGVFAVLLSVEQLGLAAQVLTALTVTVVASAGLAFALAFGLGCRELARDFLVELLRSMHDDAPDRPR